LSQFSYKKKIVPKKKLSVIFLHHPQLPNRTQNSTDMSVQTFANNSSIDGILSSLMDLSSQLASQHEKTEQRFENIEGTLREISLGQEELKQEVKTLKAAPPKKSPVSTTKKTETPVKRVSIPSSPFRHPFPGVALEGCCRAIVPGGNLFPQCWKAAITEDGFCNGCAGKEAPLGVVEERIADPNWTPPNGKPMRNVEQYRNYIKLESRPTQDEYRNATQQYYGQFGIEFTDFPAEQWNKPKVGRKPKDALSPKKEPNPVGRPPKPEVIVTVVNEVEEVQIPVVKPVEEVQIPVVKPVEEENPFLEAQPRRLPPITSFTPPDDESNPFMEQISIKETCVQGPLLKEEVKEEVNPVKEEVKEEVKEDIDDLAAFNDDECIDDLAAFNDDEEEEQEE
jgi:hypothetical protein